MNAIDAEWGPGNARPDSEALLAAIVDSSDAAIFANTLQGTIVTWNRGAERLYGYSREEALGRHILTLAPPEAENEVLSNLRRIRAGGHVEHLETVRRTRSGRLVSISLSVSPVCQDGRIVGASAIARDITDQRVAVEALRRSEAMSRGLVESAPDGIIGIDGEGRIRFANPGASRIFGYARGEMVGQSVEMLVPEARRGVHAGERRRFIGNAHARLSSARLGLEGQRKDGSCFPADITLGRFTAGDEPRVVAFIRDLTDWRQLEEERREADARYRSLVEHIPAVTYVGAPDLTGPPVYVSPQMQELLGYPVEAWLTDGAFMRSILFAEDAPRLTAARTRSRQTGQPFELEYRVAAADGRTVWVRDQMALTRDADGRPMFWQGILVDITRQREADAELRDLIAARNDLLARLVSAQEEERRRIAADLHDDVIQKIAALSMRLDMAIERHPDLAEDVQFARLRAVAAESIASLRTAMFRLRPPRLQQERLAESLRAYLAEEVGERAIAYSVDESLRARLDDPVRMALFRIAQEAIVNALKHAAPTSLRVELREAMGGALLRVADDGRGWTPDGRLESPAGHLGLTAMRERAESVGGWLRIDSAPGAGTTVECFAPATAG